MAFYAYFNNIAPAANKYMATLFNTSATRKAVVHRIYRYSRVEAAITGVLLVQEIRFITARTAGTAITPINEDTNDSLDAAITADTGSTGVTEGSGARSLVKRFYASTEEVLLAELTTSPEGAAAHLHDAQIIYWRKEGSKGLVLRQNQGITIKNVTSSTVGGVSYYIEFTDEAA